MKKLNIIFLLSACLGIFVLGCEKEEVSSQDFTKAYFVGKWPLRTHIEISKKNNLILTNDTIKLSPVDTLTYTAEGKYTRGTTTVNYTIDATGDHITYATTPSPTIWVIKNIRTNGIILSQEKTTQVGADTFTYYTEDQLIK